MSAVLFAVAGKQSVMRLTQREAFEFRGRCGLKAKFGAAAAALQSFSQGGKGAGIRK
jgi:hypothetical protein